MSKMIIEVRRYTHVCLLKVKVNETQLTSADVRNIALGSCASVRPADIQSCNSLDVIGPLSWLLLTRICSPVKVYVLLLVLAVMSTGNL